MECFLEKGELMRLEGGRRGIVLRCLRGTIWLTIGDGRDYLLRQGASFELRQGTAALAQALGTAEMRLEAHLEAVTTAPVAARHCRSFC